MFCLLKMPPDHSKIPCPTAAELVPGKLYHQAPVKNISDSFTEQRGDEILILEGIVANGKRLRDAYAVRDLKELLWQAMQDNSILGKLHGQFFVALYNVVSGDFKVFTSHIGTVRIYYYQQGDALIVSDKIKTIVEILTSAGIHCPVSELGARMILAYGYTLEGFTTIAGVKQLPSASCLSYAGGILDEKRYFSWNFDTLYTSTHKHFRELFQIFSDTVSDAFSRDEDYEHLAFLSGGMDSRLVVYMAHKLGYKGFSVLNFSEPGYLDATIARDIAKELDLKLNFFSLEGGEYLRYIDQNLVYQEGQIMLHGAAHLFYALQNMPLARYGILHSGQIGAVINGSYLAARHHTPVNLMPTPASAKILSPYANVLDSVRDKYPNHEAFTLYNRAINAMTNGDLASYHFSHSLSPFLAPDFMQYVLNIDPAKRYGNFAYLAWIKYCFPAASRHTWEKTGAKPSDPYWLVRLKYNAWRGSDKIKRKLTKQPNRLSMNPFEYWWQSNNELRDHLNQKFSCLEQAAPFLDQELEAKMNELYQSRSLSDKLQAYTLARGVLHLLKEDDTMQDINTQQTK